MVVLQRSAFHLHLNPYVKRSAVAFGHHRAVPPSVTEAPERASPPGGPLSGQVTTEGWEPLAGTQTTEHK